MCERLSRLQTTAWWDELGLSPTERIEWLWQELELSHAAVLFDCPVQQLFWISSLGPDEIGVTDRILEDLEPHCERLGLPFERYDPETADEFLKCLDNIIGRTTVGSLPMIHLDLHGSVKDGVRIAQSGEHVSWTVVADKFRSINVATGNNLCVISGACFSFEVVRQVDVNQPAPFFILVAPQTEVTAGILEASVLGFYRDILGREDLISAHERWFTDRLRLFHCERMLGVVLLRYIDMACKGKNADDRREYLVSMAMKNGLANTRKNRRMARSFARKKSKPSEDLINRFVDTFLIGKRPNFTINQLNRFVDDARMSGTLSPREPFPFEVPD